MVGLLDIAPAVASVTVRGRKVPVHGVSIGGVVQLLTRFPELKQMIGGRGGVDAAKLVASGGALAGAIIAAGIGFPGDHDQEDAAARLPIGDQVDLLEVIIKVTLPNGVAPFVARLTALGVLVAGPSATAPVTKSRKR